jgi:NAD(P)H-binding
LVTVLPKTVKVITVSNIGVGESRQYQNLFVKFFLVDRFMAGILKDKLIAETALADSGITKWTALRVGWLSNSAENLDKVKFLDTKDASTISRASRKDVGAVALKLVEDGYGDEYWGKAIHLASG